MIVIKGYKTELKLNNKQQTVCARHAGTARWAYNWGLARKISVYEQTGESLSALDLHRELVQLKKTELRWLHEVSKCAPQEALRDLDKAFQNFFRRVNEGAKEAGFPRYKSKKRGYGSFRLPELSEFLRITYSCQNLGGCVYMNLVIYLRMLTFYQRR